MVLAAIDEYPLNLPFLVQLGLRTELALAVLKENRPDNSDCPLTALRQKGPLESQGR
ncbi:hypothetical protein D3C72_2396140 [compost metagenome]